MGGRVYLTDKEVSTVLEVSQQTLYRILGGFVRGGARRATLAEREIDLSSAKPERVGGYRRWNAERLAAVLGITKDELLARIA